MSLELTRMRAFVLALAMVVSAAFVVELAQAGPAAAAKSKKQKPKRHKAKKPHKKKRKAGPKRGPAGLKFYAPPKKVPAGHGKLIWQRKAGGVVPLKSAATTRLVLYTSKSPSGKRVAVSGSVSVPKGKPPKGGWPIISYGHGTTGIADKCAPSRNTANGPATAYISYMDPLMNEWLSAGYAVARTDYQGLGTPGLHPFLVGKAEGRGVLDIVRASRQLGLKIGKRFLIAGHSQGGHAALFAAGQAAGWTPDLKLKGTVAYAPASHFKEQASALGVFTGPNQLTALATLLVRGMTVEYPQIDPQTLLSDEVLPFWQATTEECLSRLGESDMLGGIAPAKLIRNPPVPEELNQILQAQNPAQKTSAPILLTQGTADTTALKVFTDMLSGELNGVGDNVDYKVYDGVDHGQIVYSAQPDALSFFKRNLPSGR